MSWTDWTLLGIFVVGFLLFLVGANLPLWYGTGANPTEVAIIGYSGVYLTIGSVAAYIVLYVYKEITKKPTAQNP